MVDEKGKNRALFLQIFSRFFNFFNDQKKTTLTRIKWMDNTIVQGRRGEVLLNSEQDNSYTVVYSDTITSYCWISLHDMGTFYRIYSINGLHD